MVKISTIFSLGVIVAFTPYLGLPFAWKNFIYIFSGIVITILSVLIRRELHEVLRHLHGDEMTTESFSESLPKKDN